MGIPSPATEAEAEAWILREISSGLSISLVALEESSAPSHRQLGDAFSLDEISCQPVTLLENSLTFYVSDLLKYTRVRVSYVELFRSNLYDTLVFWNGSDWKCARCASAFPGRSES